jgi:hypothetical protein
MSVGSAAPADFDEHLALRRHLKVQGTHQSKGAQRGQAGALLDEQLELLTISNKWKFKYMTSKDATIDATRIDFILSHMGLHYRDRARKGELQRGEAGDTMVDAMSSCVLTVSRCRRLDHDIQTRLTTHKSMYVGASELIKAALIVLTLVAVSAEDELVYSALDL